MRPSWRTGSARCSTTGIYGRSCRAGDRRPPRGSSTPIAVRTPCSSTTGPRSRSARHRVQGELAQRPEGGLGLAAAVDQPGVDGPPVALALEAAPVAPAEPEDRPDLVALTGAREGREGALQLLGLAAEGGLELACAPADRTAGGPSELRDEQGLARVAVAGHDPALLPHELHDPPGVLGVGVQGHGVEVAAGMCPVELRQVAS